MILTQDFLQVSTTYLLDVYSTFCLRTVDIYPSYFYLPTFNAYTLSDSRIIPMAPFSFAKFQGNPKLPQDECASLVNWPLIWPLPVRFSCSCTQHSFSYLCLSQGSSWKLTGHFRKDMLRQKVVVVGQVPISKGHGCVQWNLILPKGQP